MELVVDANILVSAFLRAAVTRELLMSDKLALRIPEYGLLETGKVLTAPSILKRLNGPSVEDFRRILVQMTARIHAEPSFVYHRELQKALKLVAHKEDAPYMALALRRRIGIWTNDLGFTGQSEVPIYSTADLLKELSRR